MNYLRPTIIGLLALLALLALFAHGQPAYAATFTVTKTADTNDGTCDADCSLREAIGAANALAGADTITVPAGTYTLSIGGAGEDLNATGDLDISDDLTINGAGAATTIIDGNRLDRVFSISATSVEPPDAPPPAVDINSVAIRNGSAGEGAGIRNAGTLTLTNSTVSGNTAVGLSFNFGGGIFNTTFGGIGGTLTITSSTVSGNSAVNNSGGIRNDGTLTLTNSTVSGNTAGCCGGFLNSGTLTLTNSTVSGNSANGDGGGIFNTFGGTLTITSSTVSGNTSSGEGGGIFNASHTTPTLKNTIVANSPTGGDCAVEVGSSIISSAGHNLDSDGTCGFTATGDLQNTDPILGPLAVNGGPTFTHALLAGSPAIDAGSLDCPPPATDQRVVGRPIDGDGDSNALCDIGAYEAPEGTTTDTPTPTPTPTPVGLGVVQLPETGGQPDSGGGARTLAIMLAATGLALAAGGWYARRRWLR